MVCVFIISLWPRRLADRGLLAGPSWISHFFSLPDKEALHFATRIGYVAASQIPISALMASKLAAAATWIPWWPKLRLSRYHGILRTTIIIMYIIHTLIMSSRFETAKLVPVLRWPLLALGLAFCVLTALLKTSKQQFAAFGQLAATIAVLAMIIWHTGAAKTYILESCFLAAVAFGCSARVRSRRRLPVAPSSKTDAKKSTSTEQYAWLRQIKPDYSGSAIFEQAYAVSVIVSIDRSWFRTILDTLHESIFSKSHVPNIHQSLEQHCTHAVEFSAKEEASADEKAALFFDRRTAILTNLLEHFIRSPTTEILIISGGHSGPLAYPVYHDILRRGTSTSVHFMLALGLRNNIWAKPHYVMPMNPIRIVQDDVLIHGDMRIANGTYMQDAIERATADPTGRLLVVTVGSDAVAEEANKLVYKSVRLRSTVYLLHFNYDPDI